MIPGKKYSPRTRTSRRPTPERFEHLRKWVEVEEHAIELTTITEITNINQQLEQTAKLYVSNIISRVIAQMVAQYGEGFVSLRGTHNGHLLVQTERESKTVTYGAIDFLDAGDHVIVAGEAGKTIHITGLVFTVGGETNITLMDGATPITGAMDFGGADEPRGMVCQQGFLPLALTEDAGFGMTTVGATQVSGYVTGYIE